MEMPSKIYNESNFSKEVPKNKTYDIEARREIRKKREKLLTPPEAEKKGQEQLSLYQAIAGRADKVEDFVNENGFLQKGINSKEFPDYKHNIERAATILKELSNPSEASRTLSDIVSEST